MAGQIELILFQPHFLKRATASTCVTVCPRSASAKPSMISSVVRRLNHRTNHLYQAKYLLYPFLGYLP